jgi:hypothetical protein
MGIALAIYKRPAMLVGIGLIAASFTKESIKLFTSQCPFDRTPRQARDRLPERRNLILLETDSSILFHFTRNDLRNVNYLVSVRICHSRTPLAGIHC